ncbi:putative membrane protein [Paenibacillus sp. V4I3]|uniref:DUF975 family protein n=1 Tax=unclassified Paenibacillus TaxID=185978 RepID=UPI002781D2D2|nr:MULTISPECIES: DUF975 family protein [unclassified Paenibacillus]MDQ0873920.1 putative membrane protein [Paenibacillus sp. V4I3]MDQ0890203.1 putative membrane protein [Paenibacillus sp. V4I9]
MYWTRRDLKIRAKNVLRTSYWKAFLVSLVLAVVSGGVSSCSFNSGGSTSMSLPGFSGGMGDISDGAGLAIILIFAFLAVVIGLVALAFNIFVVSPLKVSVQQYFKQAAQDDVNMNYLVYSFTKGNYLAIVKGMFWSGLLNFLWFLLLIIPGIVKSYAYSMTPFILADNPGIGMKRAVDLSNQMTRGQKWKMFVLDLSFIGWFILGTLALGIGVLFVLPYYNSTKAELYLVIRQQALHDGISSSAELNLPYV